MDDPRRVYTKSYSAIAEDCSAPAETRIMLVDVEISDTAVAGTVAAIRAGRVGPDEKGPTPELAPSITTARIEGIEGGDDGAIAHITLSSGERMQIWVVRRGNTWTIVSTRRE